MYGTHVLSTYLHHMLLQSIPEDIYKCPVPYNFHVHKEENMQLYSVEHTALTHDNMYIITKS